MSARLPLTAGETRPDVWCEPCSANVAIRIPLHYGDVGRPVIAHLTVCASCGTRYLPSVPVATLAARPWRIPNPVLAVLWTVHRRASAKRGVRPVPCAYGDCRRPGWRDCSYAEPVDGGVVTWMFCGKRHRRAWTVQHLNLELAGRRQLA